MREASPYTIFDWDLRTGRVYVPDTAQYQGWDYNIGFFIKSNEPSEAEEEFTLSVFSDPNLERQISSQRFFIAEGNDDYVSVEETGSNIVNNTINNISNTTVVNIDNAGSGNVTIGDIGSVNNTTTIDNFFTVKTTNINLSLAIAGDSEKSEKVVGTDGDDLITDGRGKDKLIGGDGADQFYFSGDEPFKRRPSIRSSTSIK